MAKRRPTGTAIVTLSDKPVVINAGKPYDERNPHSWLRLTGDPAGFRGIRFMHGTLRLHLGENSQRNSAEAFFRAKCRPAESPDPLAVTACRHEVLVPMGVDDTYADPWMLHDTTAAGLQRYLKSRGPGSGDNPVFADRHGRPLRYIAVKETFDRLVGKVGIRPTSARRPRLHDLRHTFAVRALQGSPTGRNRCGAHMVALATYMGHVNIYATYWYLEATADLVRDIAVAGEMFMSEGKRV